MRDWLRIIRIKNLLIVVFSQLIVYLTVNWEFLSEDNIKLSPALFFLLMLSTIMITGAGYIINDYFDVKIDSINKPKELIISNSISSKRALLVHNIINFLAVIIAGFVAYKVGNVYLVLTQIISITLLVFYSTHFKKMSIIGNVVVSVMTALSVFIIFLFEPNMHAYFGNTDIIIGGRINPAIHIIVVSVFALLLNWMREIIKDIEDFKGDHELGCKTYPIVYGLRKSINLVHALNMCTIALLIICMVSLFYINNYLSGVILIIPLVGLCYFSYKLPLLSSFRQFGKLSALLKWLMVIGLLDLLVIVYF